MSDTHTITVEWDTHSYPAYSLRCDAPAESLCHAVYTCECESWGDAGVEDGRPWHVAVEYDDATDDASDVRHYGQLIADECAHRDWFENSDETIHGALTFPVRADWDGETIAFRPVDPALEIVRLRAENEHLVGEVARARGLSREQVVVSCRAASAAGASSTLDGASTTGTPNAWPADAAEFAARWNLLTPHEREIRTRTITQNAELAIACLHEQRHRDRIAVLTEALASAELADEATILAALQQHQLDLGFDTCSDDGFSSCSCSPSSDWSGETTGDHLRHLAASIAAALAARQPDVVVATFTDQPAAPATPAAWCVPGVSPS